MTSRLPLALVGALALVAIRAPLALGAQTTVLNNHDAGPGSLRDSVAGAPDGGTVVVPSSVGTITLTSEIVIDRSVTIMGSGAPDPTVAANRSSRIFHIVSPTSGPAPVVALSSLGLMQGAAHLGGAVDQEAGDLTLTAMTLSGNTASPSGAIGGSGGAIFQQAGSLTIRASAITGNTASAGSDAAAGGGTGGGLYHAGGSLRVENTSVSSNVASALAGAKGGTGGGIFDQVGTVAVSASHIDSDTAQAGAGGAVGGGIFHGDGSLTLTGGSVSGDVAQAGTDPGGSGSDAGSQSPASGSAISGVGGGIYDRTGGLSIAGTTLSGDAAYPSSGDNGMGGAIYHERDSLGVSGATFTDDQAGPPGDTGGGGVAGALFDHSGPVQISSTTFAGNTAFGGANPSTPGNSGPAGTGSLAGAIYAKTGTLDVEQSTLSGNTAGAGTGKDGFAGALYNQAAAVTLTNDTIDGNTAGVGARRGLGGGIYTQRFDGATTALNNVTLSANAATGSAGEGSDLFDDAAASPAGVTLVHNTIIGPSAPGAAPNCAGPITSHGHNLDSGNSCGLAGAGDLVSRDPLLGPLAVNAPGTTATRAVSPPSPAVDAGENADCPATDQRGQPRPVDGSGRGGAICDMGAYEYAPPGWAPNGSPGSPGSPAPNAPGPVASGPRGPPGPTAPGRSGAALAQAAVAGEEPLPVAVASLADGDADVTVTAPGPGALVVGITVTTGRVAARVLAGAASRRPGHGVRRRGAMMLHLAVSRPGEVHVRVHPAGRARRLLRQGGRVAGRVSVRFTAPGGQTRAGTTGFTFAKRVRSRP